MTFENVSFAYPDREHTLRDISFSAEPGQRVAIVGPTGAGKTTLINLLVRYYDPKAGRLLIDDVDVRRLKLDSLREQISVVLQEPLLFSGSIADNIRYGKLGATMEEVVAAAKAANAHDFIERQPKGYETLLGERGAQLSGGERQRIAVARAFIKDAPILVLDEPTSSIDSRTEEVILNALDELMEGRTSFMIAHRLSTIRDADLIVVLQAGEVVEQGSHQELVQARGLYHDLYEAQTRQRRRQRRRASVQQRRAIGGGNGHAARRKGIEPEAGDFDRPSGPEHAADRRRKGLSEGDFDALRLSDAAVGGSAAATNGGAESAGRGSGYGAPPEAVIRGYLDTVGGEVEVPFHNLTTTWQVEEPTAAERHMMSEALERVGVSAAPGLSRLRPDDRVRLRCETGSRPAMAQTMHSVTVPRRNSWLSRNRWW